MWCFAQRPSHPRAFLIRATHATLCVVCRGIGVLPQIDYLDRESVIVQASEERAVRFGYAFRLA